MTVCSGCTKTLCYVNMDVEDAISSLEALASQLESAVSKVDDSALSEAISESVSVADAVLSPQDRLLWQGITTSILPEAQAPMHSEEKKRVTSCEPSTDACANIRCGTPCTDEDLKRRCTFDCGVRFCNATCWKLHRSMHERICCVLQKKLILKKLGIMNGDADELF